MSVRHGQPDVRLSRVEFEARFKERFVDPVFAAIPLAPIIDAAWDAYDGHRKAPRTQKAGLGFADPNYDLSQDWIATSEAIKKAQAHYSDPHARARVLLINGSARNEHTCPSEMSKTHRLVEHAKNALGESVDVDELDLSRLTAEYGRNIHPCKACVSTAMPLCHWPCSCYPNHALGQTQDWMADIYPMWARASGVMIISPVYWYQAPSVLKLMMDRLVCADGGNPDPTSTQGKDAKKAKHLELDGWPYPKHLAGRVFGVLVHGDAEGLDLFRTALTTWLGDMGLVIASTTANIGRYIGYYEPYASSHEALDKDKALFEETANIAKAITAKIAARRQGQRDPDETLQAPRPK